MIIQKHPKHSPGLWLMINFQCLLYTLPFVIHCLCPSFLDNHGSLCTLHADIQREQKYCFVMVLPKRSNDFNVFSFLPYLFLFIHFIHFGLQWIYKGFHILYAMHFSCQMNHISYKTWEYFDMHTLSKCGMLHFCQWYRQTKRFISRKNTRHNGENKGGNGNGINHY